MIQRRQHAGFTGESRYAFVIITEGLRHKFDGDAASQLRVRGLIHLSHTARSEVTGDLVV